MYGRKKIALVEVWMGKIPDYFSYHIETIRSLTSVDFYFFSNDKEYDFGSIDYKNFYFNYITEEEFLDRFNKTSEIKIDKISNPRKIIDFKLSYFEMFSDYVSPYSYVGIYDIDTLFGDLNDTLLESLEKYDFISIGDEIFHNRLSGPLLIMRNTQEFRNLMKSDRYYETLLASDIYGYGEQELSKIAFDNYKVKLIYSINTDPSNGGKNIYDAYWSGGKLFIGGEEKLLYHFYRKDHTKFQRIGNSISAYYDKKYLNDFLWVVHFSEKYETLLPYLMDSLKKFSNRKCVFYSINYSPSFMYKTQTESDQFIFRRIDMEPGPLDSRGRDSRIMNSKPLVLMDAIKSFPGKKFVHIDTDIYLTSNSDDISKYFDRIENYPLINSHVHDVMYISGVNPDEEWTSPLHVLLNAMGEEKGDIFPRRKCNVIAFDERSYWFFEEQMSLYNQFKDSGIPGILAIFDEDTANALLTKYQLKNCLPLVDIEESYNLNVEKIYNYSYNMTGTSPWAELPKNINDLLFFHGFKDPSDYREIQNQYGDSTIENEEMILKYSNGAISFEKNSFMTTKKIESLVDFVVHDSNGVEILRLSQQDFHRYWLFYIDEINLDRGKYLIKIFESSSQKCIFNDILQIA
jgi:hypothetical protein